MNFNISGGQDMKEPPFYSSIFQRHEMPILLRFLTPSSRRHHWIHYPHFQEQLWDLLAISTTHHVNDHACNQPWAEVGKGVGLSKS